jgi:protein-disulfide isomerase
MHTEYLTMQERHHKRNKTVVIWIASAIILGLSVYGIVVMARSSAESLKTSGAVPAVSSADKLIGNTEAPVVITEYADFQCPSCKAADPLLKQLLSEYGSKVTLVYRNFPLKQIHSTAILAASAAEAASMQGKFWEMHDLLYQNQAVWADQSTAGLIFENFARETGLNVDQFKKDMNSDAVVSKINQDYDEAVRLKLDHTPTFAVNGKIVENPRGYDEFKKLVDGQLK